MISGKSAKQQYQFGGTFQNFNKRGDGKVGGLPDLARNMVGGHSSKKKQTMLLTRKLNGQLPEAGGYT